MPGGHVQSHSGDVVKKKSECPDMAYFEVLISPPHLRLPVCIVAEFIYGGEADSRPIKIVVIKIPDIY